MIVAADFDPIAGIHDNRKLGTAHHQISDLCLVQFHCQAQVITGFLRKQSSGQPQKRRILKRDYERPTLSATATSAWYPRSTPST